MRVPMRCSHIHHFCRHAARRSVQTFLDTVFPPSADMCLVRRAEPGALRARAASRRVQNDSDAVALLSYREPLVRACVHEAKFHGSRKATLMLGAALRAHLETLPEGRTFVLVPIPLSRARLRERGYNQVSEIAKAALADDSLPNVVLREDLLKRMRHTKRQTDLPHEKRKRNVADAFGVRDQRTATDTLAGAHLILLDDVVTTGATITAARASLARHHPTSLTCLALAH